MKIFQLTILLYLFSSMASAHAEVEMKRTAYSFIFSTYKGKKYEVIFTINPNKKTEFNGISLICEGKKIEIDAAEIDINTFTSLDDVRLSFDEDRKTTYLLIVDNIGTKGARKENTFYFNEKDYVKRLTLTVSDKDEVEYRTKEKGKDEIKDFNVSPPDAP